MSSNRNGSVNVTESDWTRPTTNLKIPFSSDRSKIIECQNTNTYLPKFVICLNPSSSGSQTNPLIIRQCFLAMSSRKF